MWFLAASPSGVEMQWRAPAGCPDASALEARIGEYAQGIAPDEPVAVDATVEAIGDRWRLRLAITRGADREERVLEDTSCEGLAESTAVLVAIAIAPASVDATPVDPPSPSVEVATPPATQATEGEPAPFLTPQVRRSDDDARRRASPQLSLRLSGGASVGWLPIGGDASLALALAWRWFRFEFSGTYGPRRRLRFDNPATSGADASGWLVGARACGVLHATPWLDVPLCGGVEAGQLLARPVRLDRGRIGRPTWIAASVGPALRFVVHPRVALWLGPEFLIGLVRGRVTVTNDAVPLFDSAAVGARLHAGIELRFR